MSRRNARSNIYCFCHICYDDCPEGQDLCHHCRKLQIGSELGRNPDINIPTRVKIAFHKTDDFMFLPRTKCWIGDLSTIFPDEYWIYFVSHAPVNANCHVRIHNRPYEFFYWQSSGPEIVLHHGTGEHSIITIPSGYMAVIPENTVENLNPDEDAYTTGVWVSAPPSMGELRGRQIYWGAISSAGVTRSLSLGQGVQLHYVVHSPNASPNSSPGASPEMQLPELEEAGYSSVEDTAPAEEEEIYNLS